MIGLVDDDQCTCTNKQMLDLTPPSRQLDRTVSFIHMFNTLYTTILINWNASPKPRKLLSDYVILVEIQNIEKPKSLFFSD